jgi:hypothetical protein
MNDDDRRLRHVARDTGVLDLIERALQAQAEDKDALLRTALGRLGITYEDGEHVPMMRHTARDTRMLDLLERALQASTIDEKNALLLTALCRLEITYEEQS